jgi:hypothetical protein
VETFDEQSQLTNQLRSRQVCEQPRPFGSLPTVQHLSPHVKRKGKFQESGHFLVAPLPYCANMQLPIHDRHVRIDDCLTAAIEILHSMLNYYTYLIHVEDAIRILFCLHEALSPDRGGTT